jgi:type III secretion system FlhB-like substrate exporter
MIRSARRRRARQMAFARMMDAVPTADVVVTNPTTLAVALKYDSLTMRAPRIVAKGQRLMAERIKQIARENKVPIVEDKPLARALFSRPVGAEVPAHLYRAVARLLVLVHQTRFAAGDVPARLGPASEPEVEVGRRAPRVPEPASRRSPGGTRRGPLTAARSSVWPPAPRRRAIPPRAHASTAERPTRPMASGPEPSILRPARTWSPKRASRPSRMTHGSTTPP